MKEIVTDKEDALDFKNDKGMALEMTRPSQSSSSHCWRNESVSSHRGVLPGVRVHGPRPDGPPGVGPRALQREPHQVFHEAAAGRTGLLPQEELPAQGHQVLQHPAQQQVSAEEIHIVLTCFSGCQTPSDMSAGISADHCEQTLTVTSCHIM